MSKTSMKSTGKKKADQKVCNSSKATSRKSETVQKYRLTFLVDTYFQAQVYKGGDEFHELVEQCVFDTYSERKDLHFELVS